MLEIVSITSDGLVFSPEDYGVAVDESGNNHHFIVQYPKAVFVRQDGTLSRMSADGRPDYIDVGNIDSSSVGIEAAIIASCTVPMPKATARDMLAFWISDNEVLTIPVMDGQAKVIDMTVNLDANISAGTLIDGWSA